MDTFRIPATVEAMVSEVGGIGELLTAKGWERIGMIYAWTDTPDERRLAIKVGDHPEPRLSMQEFADLGIYGLSDLKTVRRLRDDWVWALNNGGWDDPALLDQAKNLRPGGEATLPNVAVRQHTETMGKFRAGLRWSAPDEDATESVRRLLAERPEVAAAIEGDFVEQVTQSDTRVGKRLQRAFIQKAGKDVELYSAVLREFEEQHPTPLPKYHPPVHLEVAGTWALIISGAERAAEKNLPRLVEFLRRMRDEGSAPAADTLADEEIRGLDDLTEYAHKYQDEIRLAVGRPAQHLPVDADVDATARRLLGGVEL